MSRHTVMLDIGAVGGPLLAEWHNPETAKISMPAPERDKALAGPENANAGCDKLDKAGQWIADNISTNFGLRVPGWIPSRYDPNDGKWYNSVQIPGGQITLQMSPERRERLWGLIRKWHRLGYKIDLYDGPLIADHPSGDSRRFGGEYQYKTFTGYKRWSTYKDVDRLVDLHFGLMRQYLNRIFLDAFVPRTLGPQGAAPFLKHLSRNHGPTEWVAESHGLWGNQAATDDRSKAKFLGRGHYASQLNHYLNHDPPPRKHGDNWCLCSHLPDGQDPTPENKIREYTKIAKHRSEPRLVIPFGFDWALNPAAHQDKIDVVKQAMAL